MKLHTTIEIEEVETNIVIDFEMQFGQPIINKITDVESGCAICPDLDETNISDILYNEILEYAANHECLPLENK